eukprot:gene11469-4633_t
MKYTLCLVVLLCFVASALSAIYCPRKCKKYGSGTYPQRTASETMSKRQTDHVSLTNLNIIKKKYKQVLTRKRFRKNCSRRKNFGRNRGNALSVGGTIAGGVATFGRAISLKKYDEQLTKKIVKTENIVADKFGRKVLPKKYRKRYRKARRKWRKVGKVFRKTFRKGRKIVHKDFDKDKWSYKQVIEWLDLNKINTQKYKIVRRPVHIRIEIEDFNKLDIPLTIIGIEYRGVSCEYEQTEASHEDLELIKEINSKLNKIIEINKPEKFVIDSNWEPLETHSAIELELIRLKRENPYYSVADEFDEDDGSAQRILDKDYEENMEFYEEQVKKYPVE